MSGLLPLSSSSHTTSQVPESVCGKRKTVESDSTHIVDENEKSEMGRVSLAFRNIQVHSASSDEEGEEPPVSITTKRVRLVSSSERQEYPIDDSPLSHPLFELVTKSYDIMCNVFMRLNPRSLYNLLECDKAFFSLKDDPVIDRSMHLFIRKGIFEEIVLLANQKTLGVEGSRSVDKYAIILPCKAARALATDYPVEAVENAKKARMFANANRQPSMFWDNIGLPQTGKNLAQDLLILRACRSGEQCDYLPLLEKGTGSINLDSAIEDVRSMSDDWMIRCALEKIQNSLNYTEVSDEDLKNLLDLVAFHNQSFAGAPFKRHIALKQAQKDVEVAIATAGSIKEEITREGALKDIALILAPHDVQRALAIADSMQRNRTKEEVRAAIASLHASIDQNAALKIAEEIKDFHYQLSAYCGIALEPLLTAENKQSVAAILKEMAKRLPDHQRKERSYSCLYPRDYLPKIAVALLLIEPNSAREIVDFKENYSNLTRELITASNSLKDRSITLAGQLIQEAANVYPQGLASEIWLEIVNIQAPIDPDAALINARRIESIHFQAKAFVCVIKAQAAQDVQKALNMVETIDDFRLKAEGFCSIAEFTAENDMHLTHQMLQKIFTLFKQHPESFLERTVKIDLLIKMADMIDKVRV